MVQNFEGVPACDTTPLDRPESCSLFHPITIQNHILASPSKFWSTLDPSLPHNYTVSIISVGAWLEGKNRFFAPTEIIATVLVLRTLDEKI